MTLKVKMTKRFCITLIVVSSLVALLLGYCFGVQAGQRAISARFEDEVFREAVEARHDGALVHLLNEKKYTDAESVAQFRYYSRVLLLAGQNRSAGGSAASSEVTKTLTEARDRWDKHRYVMPNATDNENLLRLMR